MHLRDHTVLHISAIFYFYSQGYRRVGAGEETPGSLSVLVAKTTLVKCPPTNLPRRKVDYQDVTLVGPLAFVISPRPLTNPR